MVDISSLIVWAFQALVAGGVGLVAWRIRDISADREKLQKRVSDLETMVAREYIPRNEFDKRISAIHDDLKEAIHKTEERLVGQLDKLAQQINKAIT